MLSRDIHRAHRDRGLRQLQLVPPSPSFPPFFVPAADDVDDDDDDGGGCGLWTGGLAEVTVVVLVAVAGEATSGAGRLRWLMLLEQKVHATASRVTCPTASLPASPFIPVLLGPGGSAASSPRAVYFDGQRV